MSVSHRTTRLGATAVAGAAAVFLAALPRSAGAAPLLDSELSLEGPREHPVLLIALADGSQSEPSLDFDLLGSPPPAQPVDDGSMRWRRKMLKVHQGLGLGLLALQLATTTVGQLAYSDKYGSNAPMTARYDATHGALAFTTLGVFAVNGAVALFAPSPKVKTHRKFDRVTLHKIGMATATAGMLAQGVLGIYTAQREGYLDQERYAKAHLAIGYATLAAVSVAVGALVF